MLTDGDNGLRYAARPAPFGIDINPAPNFYWFTLVVFAIALFPDLAYFILFLPMVLVLVFMPQGLFGRVPS